MRRFTTVILILSGTMFSAFIFVLGLYAASPGFREQLTGAVAVIGALLTGLVFTLVCSVGKMVRLKRRIWRY